MGWGHAILEAAAKIGAHQLDKEPHHIDCSMCKGRGRMNNKQCKYCNGTGKLKLLKC